MPGVVERGIRIPDAQNQHQTGDDLLIEEAAGKKLLKVRGTTSLFYVSPYSEHGT